MSQLFRSDFARSTQTAVSLLKQLVVHPINVVSKLPNQRQLMLYSMYFVFANSAYGKAGNGNGNGNRNVKLKWKLVW